MPDPLTSARARWRSAEDQLFPALMANPQMYQRALAEIQALVAELRRRGDDRAVLLTADADPGALLTQVRPGGICIPGDLAVGVACGARDRQLTDQANRRRAEQSIADARAAGRPWAVLAGPEDPADLTEGDSVALHLPTGTVVTATVDMWSGGPPYGLRIAPPDGEPACSWFRDRADWLDACRRGRTDLSGPAPAEVTGE